MKSCKTKSDIKPRVIKLIHSVLNYYIVYSEINEAELGKMKKKLTLLDPLGLFLSLVSKAKKFQKGKEFSREIFHFLFSIYSRGVQLLHGVEKF